MLIKMKTRIYATPAVKGLILRFHTRVGTSSTQQYGLESELTLYESPKSVSPC